MDFRVLSDEQLAVNLDGYKASIKAGQAWDRANDHKVWEYSAQAANDKKMVRLMRQEQQRRTRKPDAIRWVPVLPMGNC